MVTENKVGKDKDNKKSKQPRIAFMTKKATCQFSTGRHPFRKTPKKSFMFGQVYGHTSQDV